VIVATIGLDPELVEVKEAIEPVPLAANPMDVVLFAQVNTVPVTEPEKDIALVFAPLHND
jgi:hypothetical protein